MRRGLWIGVALLVIAAGILVGVGAYHAGVNDGIQQAANSEQIVQVVGGHWGYGFPFGLFVFPLVIFGIFAIVASAKRRRWASMGPGGPGWSGPGRWGYDERSVEEYHRRLHEQGSGDHPDAGGEPAQRA